jgi:hypothetical protein
MDVNFSSHLLLLVAAGDGDRSIVLLSSIAPKLRRLVALNVHLYALSKNSTARLLAIHQQWHGSRRPTRRPLLTRNASGSGTCTSPPTCVIIKHDVDAFSANLLPRDDLLFVISPWTLSVLDSSEKLCSLVSEEPLNFVGDLFDASPTPLAVDGGDLFVPCRRGMFHWRSQ